MRQLDVTSSTRVSDTSRAAGAHADSRTRRPDRAADVFAVLYGVVTTLVVHGYQFGRGNHTVYLLDPLRRAFPELLTNDWFTTSTLQYHTIFGWVSGWLMRVGQIERAFIVGYVALAVLLNVAWFKLVRRMGGSRLTYLLSVLLYYLSAAGAGLGVYQFLQDSSFLPSNISNVAMLWGIYLWMSRRYGWAGVALGIAGVFHLNHAVVALGLWMALSVWQRIIPTRGYWIGTAVVAVLCLANIGLALNVLANRSGRMPLEQFVALYVKLRHPHHYDPLAWPIALWVSFVWPLPFVAALLPFTRRRLDRLVRRSRASDETTSTGVSARRSEATVHARQQAARVFALICALLVVALLGAGLTYVSEALAQMSLYRFSIYVKLLSITAAAYFVCDSGLFSRTASRALIATLILVAVVAVILFVKTPAPFVWWHRGALALFTGLSVVPALYAFRPPRAALLVGAIALAAVPVVAWGRWLGMTTPPRLDAEYLEICRKARDTTPKDAVFLVPPDEEAFRLHAQRAIVVNFKSVPQLSSELTEWQKRLRRVLDTDDLLALPRPLHLTFAAIRDRYESLPPEHLFEVAREYGARYVVVGHRLPKEYEPKLAFTDGKGDFCVYDLAAGGAMPLSPSQGKSSEGGGRGRTGNSSAIDRAIRNPR